MFFLLDFTQNVLGLFKSDTKDAISQTDPNILKSITRVYFELLNLDRPYKAPLVFFTLCLASCLILNLISVICRPKRIKNIPMVCSSMPFLNSLDLIFPKAKTWVDSPCMRFLRLSQEYGEVYQIRLGTRLIVVANSYNSIRSLWCNKNIKGNNSRPKTHSFHNVLSKGVYTIGTTPMGESYKKARKHISEKVLCEKRNKDYNSYVIHLVANEMINRLISKREQGNGNTISDDLVKECQYFHLKVALWLTYAFELDLQNPEHIKLANTIIRVENEITRVRSHVQNIQDYLQKPLRFLWGLLTDYENKTRQLSEDRQEYLTLLFDHAAKLFEKCVNQRIFDEIVVESLLFDYFYSSHTHITDEEITSICLTMVSAGLDNVALNFKYGVFQLASNPGLWERGYLDLVNLFTSERLAYENCHINSNCNYITAIVKETLRMFTVLPMALPRQTTAPIQYRNALLPKGTILFMNCWAGNHDLLQFGDPMSFQPQRYLTACNELNDLKHFSYGIGCRMCLGSQFANKELYILFSKFLLKFVPHENQPTLPQNPLELNKFPESLAIEPIDFEIRLKLRQTEIRES